MKGDVEPRNAQGGIAELLLAKKEGCAPYAILAFSSCIFLMKPSNRQNCHYM